MRRRSCVLAFLRWLVSAVNVGDGDGDDDAVHVVAARCLLLSFSKTHLVEKPPRQRGWGLRNK